MDGDKWFQKWDELNNLVESATEQLDEFAGAGGLIEGIRAMRKRLIELRTERDAALEDARVQNKACAEEMHKRAHMEANWNAIIESTNRNYNERLAAETREREVSARLRAAQEVIKSNNLRAYNNGLEDGKIAGIGHCREACIEALESKRDWHPGNISGAIMPKRAADVIRGIKTDDVLERISNATGHSAVEPGSGS